MNSSNRDVELGLDTLGQEVVDGGSLVMGVEDDIVVDPGALLGMDGGIFVDVLAGHSYVGQHSPIDGSIILQSSDSGGRHSLVAQVTSASKHWQIWHGSVPLMNFSP